MEQNEIGWTCGCSSPEFVITAGANEPLEARCSKCKKNVTKELVKAVNQL